MFLSTGDTCRSPMAAGYFRQLLIDCGIEGFEVKTAGVMTVTGLRASQEALQVLDTLEIDLARHRSSQLTPEGIHRADLILGMSPLHVQHAFRESSEARGKTFLLKEYAYSDLKNIQISDPMGCTLEVFKKCFKEIRDACDKLTISDFVTKLASVDDGRVTAQQASEKIYIPIRPKPMPEASEAEAGPEAAPEAAIDVKETPAEEETSKTAAPSKADAPAEEATSEKATSSKAEAPAKKQEKKVPTKKAASSEAKAPAKKADKKTPATKAASTKAKTSAKKADKKAPAKKAAPAKAKAPAKKTVPKKAAQKASPKKAPAKKATAKKAPAKKNAAKAASKKTKKSKK